MTTLHNKGHISTGSVWYSLVSMCFYWPIQCSKGYHFGTCFLGVSSVLTRDIRGHLAMSRARSG